MEKEEGQKVKSNIVFKCNNFLCSVEYCGMNR